MLRTVTLTGSWDALPTLSAIHVSILNNSGGDLSIRFESDSSNTITIPTGQSVGLPVPAQKLQNIEVNGASGEIQLVIDV